MVCALIIILILIIIIIIIIIIQNPSVKVCVRSIMDTMEVCSVSHHVLEVCVKKYAAFRGKER